jgi:glycosyltransferase involved in cell wall biosynthesis
LRLLLVSPCLPLVHATHGGAVYLFALASALARRVELRITAFATPSEREGVSGLPAGLAGATLVPRLERRDLSRLQRAVRAAGYGANCLLRGLPLGVLKMHSTAMTRALHDEVASFRPDAVMLEMAVMAQYLDALRPAPVVLTDHEAATAVPAKVLPWGLGRSREIANWERYFERRFRQPERLQALNAEDAASLGRRFGREVGVRPPIVLIPKRSASPGAAPERFLFFGDWSHAPNPEAARYLVDAVLPRLRERAPNARLVLAGPRGGPELAALADRPGVELAGFVANLDALLGSVRAVVAPLLSGDGSRIKVLTALAHGVPVVGNARALRGVDAGSPATRCHESPDALAAACAELAREPRLAAESGAAARAWAEARLSADAVAAMQLDAVRALLDARRDGSPRGG